MERDILKLIQWIVWYASTCELSLTRLRLVKFLYLADLYFARENNGQTFSTMPWAFINYGPYCLEAIKEIDTAVSLGLIEEQPYESQYDDKKSFCLYRSRLEETPSLTIDLPTYMSSELRWAIRKWGEDSGGLLDYVYFETEPMLNVHKGDILEFSSARLPVKQPKIEMKQLSKKRLSVAKEALRKLSQKTLANEKICTRSIYDEKYFSFLASLDESDLDTGIDGVAEIRI